MLVVLSFVSSSLLASLHTKAQSLNPNYGKVLLSGKDWLNGNGVDVHINGQYTDNLYGGDWQCVSLVNDLYKAKGWIKDRWPGNGNEMFGTAPANFSKERDGSITSINPGDVIILNGGPAGLGHVAIVDSVDNNIIHTVSQNLSQTNARKDITWNKGRKVVVWSGFTTIGIVHAPGGSPPATPRPQPTPDTTPPSTPVLSGHVQYDLQSVLSWSGSVDNVGVAGYDVYRTSQADGTNSNAGTILLVNLSSGVASFTDTPPAQGVSYIYDVVAYDQAGNRSNISNFVTLVLPDSWRSSYTGDFNGDGKSDVLTLGNDGGDGADFMVFISTGSSFLPPVQWWRGVGWNRLTMKIMVADVNGDGRADIVSLGVPSVGSSDIQVFLSTGSGFLPPQQWANLPGWNWNGMKPIVGDFNGDGKFDVASLGQPGDGADIVVWLSTGTSFLPAQQWLHLPGWNWLNMRIVAIDFNNDGKTDILNIGVPSPGSTDFILFTSNGSGFNSGQQLWLGQNWSWDGMKVIVGDFTGDGLPDIASLGKPGNGSDLVVWRNLGTSLAQPQEWLNLPGWDWNFMKLAAGDFTGSGKTSLASLGIPNPGSSDMQVFTSTGNSFSNPQQWMYLPGWSWDSMWIV